MASTIGPRPWSANSRLYLPVEYDRAIAAIRCNPVCIWMWAGDRIFCPHKFLSPDENINFSSKHHLEKGTQPVHSGKYHECTGGVPWKRRDLDQKLIFLIFSSVLGFLQARRYSRARRRSGKNA
jgi:hypothetical protein